jgi:nucleoside-diphosphate-sugar epimerase
MKVFVAGGSGAIGRRLVPRLMEAGHEVVVGAHSRQSANAMRELGAEAVLADGLDADSLTAAVVRAEPEVVIHEMTALGRKMDLRRFDRWFALTNELRTRGTDNLIRAARLAGARRLIAQSYTGWTNERTGGSVKTEDDPLDPDPPRAMRQSLAAIRYLEQAVPGADDLTGVVLRYGGLYGPGTATSGEVQEAIRRRRMPLIGNGAGVWSFLHVDDAAAATVAALTRGAPGVYNVVDDDPAPASVWLPHLARVAGAKPPRRIPAGVARVLAGEVPVVWMTSIRGSSNAKARRELGWEPRYRSWRDGFAATASDETGEAPPALAA